jgi:chemotaxis protein methyltransferase CheR
VTFRRRMAELVESRSAIRLRLDASFKSLEHWLESRVGALGLGSPNEYLQRLDGLSNEDSEWRELIATVSNGQTAFFRDRTQMTVVGDAMEEIAATRKRPLQIWSAGCSTGEEAYTITAMARLRKVNVEVLATDIDVTALERAREGRYGAWSLRRFPSDAMDGLVHEVDGGFEVDPCLRENLTLTSHNLAHEKYPRAPSLGWDIILCRNVLIYFSDPNAEKVFSRLGQRLAPDGWLFVGPADALRISSEVLHAVQVGGRTVFRHTGAEPRLPVSSLPPRRKPLCSIAEPLDIASSPSRPTFAAAVDRMRRERFDEARDALLAVLEREPTDVAARVTLGNLHLGAHRYEAAADAYAEAHVHHPLLPELHYFQAILHKKTGNLAGAADASRRALFLDPQFWPAATLRASVLFRQGDSARGMRQITALTDLLTAAPTVELLSSVEGLRGIFPSVEDARAMCAHYLPARRP